ncbi:MAG: prepilin-type N-terminal cleavage/methylation domain-containing protein [Terrimicrobiaceae bacterium]|nr:prepilin-type N-terminal cleavage/methylation domain-containing protein [Terrimicrobiaceae bacterium]
MKNNPSSLFGAATRRRAAAFSLVELLVVLAVVAILGVVTIAGFSSINRGAAARGAADLAASMALSARIESLTMGAGALLAIDNGPNTNNRWRRMAVFRRVPNPADPSASIPQMVGQPVRFQGSIHFLPAYSRGYQATNLDFPGAPNLPVLAFHFTSTGQASKAPGDDDIRLVFGPGPVGADGKPVQEALAAARAGFLLRPNGRPTFFTSPDEMPPVN